MFEFLTATGRDLRRAKHNMLTVEATHKIDGVFTTPDAATIDQRGTHALVVFDAMMEGRPMHHVLEQFDPNHYGRCFTDVNVRCWRNKVTEVVLAFDAQGEEHPNWAEANKPGYAAAVPVCGDLVAVPKSAIFALDRIMRNNIQYDRKLVPVRWWQHKSYYSHFHGRTHITQENMKRADAYIYLARPDVWDIGESWEPLPCFSARNENKPRWYSHHESPNRR